MNPFLLKTLALLLSINAVAFALGFGLGRFGERRAIMRWLWGQVGKASIYGMFNGVENGEHRKRRP